MQPTVLLVTSSPNSNTVEQLTEPNQNQLSFHRTAVVSMRRFIMIFIFSTKFPEPSWLHVGVGDVCWARRCSSLSFNTKLPEVWLHLRQTDLNWPTSYVWSTQFKWDSTPVYLHWHSFFFWIKVSWRPLERLWDFSSLWTLNNLNLPGNYWLKLSNNCTAEELSTWKMNWRSELE